MTTAAALAACCVVLFGPLPVLLSRAKWPTRAPRSAVLVWQAIGLAGSLAAIGAGLAVAVTPLRSSVPVGTLHMIERALDGHPLAGLGLYEALGLTIATDVALVLSAGLATTVIRTFRARSRHRRILDLVSEHSDQLPGAALLNHPQAVAYCVPGIRSRIVLSAGALAALDSSELGAVMAHERGHTHARHDLVMLPFASLIDLLSWMPYARLAPPAVATLLEMAADDFACRSFDRRVVATALVHLAAGISGRVPSCTFGAAGSSAVVRVRRLLGCERNSRPIGILALAAACTVLTLPITAVLVPLLVR